MPESAVVPMNVQRRIAERMCGYRGSSLKFIVSASAAADRRRRAPQRAGHAISFTMLAISASPLALLAGKREYVLLNYVWSIDVNRGRTPRCRSVC